MFFCMQILTYLLLEVPPLFLVHKHQVKIVPHRELLVDVLHGRGKFISTQEEPDGNGLPCIQKTVQFL